MSKPFGSLAVNPWQWGVDGEEELRSDTDPERWAGIKAGTANVGWGQFVKFDVDPNDADGLPIDPSAVPGYGLKYPVTDVAVTLTDGFGGVVGSATLQADSSGAAEGEVAEGDPVHLNMRHYDESHGMGIKVTCGNKVGGGFHPANAGRCKVTVTFSTQGVSGAFSYYVS